MIICCPDCGWEPYSYRTRCECGFRYNIYQTLGVCPRCLRHVSETQCFRCKSIGPIERWYPAADDGGFPKKPMFFHFRELRIEADRVPQRG